VRFEQFVNISNQNFEFFLNRTTFTIEKIAKSIEKMAKSAEKNEIHLFESWNLKPFKIYEIRWNLLISRSRVVARNEEKTIRLTLHRHNKIPSLYAIYTRRNLLLNYILYTVLIYLRANMLPNFRPCLKSLELIVNG
jgi:hypothetical protein